MNAITFEIIVILALLLVNGIFAMSEIAVVASRRIRLEQRAAEGNEGARAALLLSAEPTQFLSTVQVGITLVGVLAGAFGGATLAENLAARFETVPWMARHAEAIALAIVVAAITYLSLIIGELVPKRIALGNPERIAGVVARPMRTLSRVASPLVALLTGSTNLVLRALRVKASTEPGVTEEEIRALVEQGTETGEVQKAERNLVEAVFRLGDRQVATIMTPRTDIEWLDVSATPGEVREAFGRPRASRVLVCDGSVDHVLGVVHAEQLLSRGVAGAAIDGAALREALRTPLYVPAAMPVYRLLELFRTSGQDVALALDEFGGVQGLATRDDILEALVGSFRGDADAAEADIVPRPDGSWLIDGMTPIQDVEALLDLATEAEAEGYHTISGFVLQRLGHLPKVGERFEHAGYAFEVVDMDARRIDRVLVSRLDQRARRGSSP